MHIPDHYLDGRISTVASVAAVGALGWAAQRSRGADPPPVQPVLGGAVTAAVFALQMLNYPVASGTSGHLLGGALAAILLGPWLGMWMVTAVLVVQTALFADGGLSALGPNVLNMAVATTLVGYGVFVLLAARLPRRRAGVVVASAVAAWASMVVAAGLFSLEYALGGLGTAGAADVAMAMLEVHSVAGLGEALLTAGVVAAVLWWGRSDDTVAGRELAASGASR